MAHDVEPYPPLSPYLMVRGAAKAIDWYGRAFGAVETEHYDHEGRVGHSTLRINGGVLMLSDDYPEYQEVIGTQSPDALAYGPIEPGVDVVHRQIDRGGGPAQDVRRLGPDHSWYSG